MINEPSEMKSNSLSLELPAWFQSRLARRTDPRRSLVIGLNAPQGAGKTTLTRAWVERLASQGLKAVSLSIDDFYLTRAEQVALAARHATNPYLQARGYPGTHDIELGRETLAALATSQRREVALPSYDKSAHSGRGDRRPRAEWKTIQTPVDVVFLEGWMLGFPMVPGSALPDPNFQFINEALSAYEPWLRSIDVFVHLKPLDPRFVIEWRIEAETRMRAEGKPGMSEAEIAAYIAMFIPAYETYLEPFARTLATRWPESKVFVIGRDRSPVG